MGTGPTLEYVSAARGVSRVRRAWAAVLLGAGGLLAVGGVLVEGIAFLMSMMPVDGLPLREFMVAWMVGAGMIIGGCGLCFATYRVGKEERLFTPVAAGAMVAEGVLLVPAGLALALFKVGDGGGMLLLFVGPAVVLGVMASGMLPLFGRLRGRLEARAGEVAVRRYFRRGYLYEVYALGATVVVVAVMIMADAGMRREQLPAVVGAVLLCGLGVVQLVGNRLAERPGQGWMAALLIVSVLQVFVVGGLLCVAGGGWQGPVLCGLGVWMGKVFLQLLRAVF